MLEPPPQDLKHPSHRVAGAGALGFGVGWGLAPATISCNKIDQDMCLFEVDLRFVYRLLPGCLALGRGGVFWALSSGLAGRPWSSNITLV